MCRPTSIYDRELGEVRDMDRPSDLKFPTVITRLNRRGFTTGTVLSKDVPLRHLRRPGDLPLGAASRSSRSLGPRARRLHDGRGDLDGRGVRPQPGLHQPRRHRPDGPLRLHRHVGQGGARPGAAPTPTCRSVASSTCSRTPGAGPTPRSSSSPTTRWTGRLLTRSSTWRRGSRRTRCWPATCRSPRTAARTSCTGPGPETAAPTRAPGCARSRWRRLGCCRCTGPASCG